MKLNFSQLNRMKQGLNAVRIFAKLGDEKQVASLLSAGGTLEDAVYGYALGGHTDQVNTLLKQHPQLLIYAAKGYARADNETEAEKLTTSGELEIKKALLEGYAQAANKTQISAAVRSRNNQQYISAIVKGLAEGDHNSVHQYAINEELQNTAITAAAQSGNVALVNELLALQDIALSKLLDKPIKPSVKLALGHALIGFSKGRHYEHIEALLKLNINPMLCLTTISNKGSIHASDIQSLCAHISDEALKHSLGELIKEHFGVDSQNLKEDFSSDAELELLFDRAFAECNSPTATSL